MIGSPRRLVAAALLVAAPALAHVLGGGGRPSSSGSSSGAGASGDPWNQLDPAAPAAGAASPEQEALKVQLKKMRAYCDSVDPAARASCLGALDVSAAAVGSMEKAVSAQSAVPAAGGARGPRGKPEQERVSEAERLRAERSRCDALEGDDAEGCYEGMRATHEAWHERHEPVHLPELPDLKKRRLARAKCMKIADVKKRHACLMGLVRGRSLRGGPPPGEPAPAPMAP